MIKVVSNVEMRQLDEFTINDMKIPGLVLMENAGLKSAQIIQKYIESNNLKGTVYIFCGKGNNGGDGYVIARQLFDEDYQVIIYSVGDPNQLKGDALSNYDSCKNLKIIINQIESKRNIKKLSNPALIVDALLGTGIKGPVSGLYEDIIKFINKQKIPVVAIDIPSGLNGDNAIPPGTAIDADFTITMALPKRAHIFYPAKKHVGKLYTVNIGIPKSKIQDPNLKLNLVEKNDIKLPELKANTHKYSSGKLFILAGSPGMTGAAYLSAAGALRTGIGLINIGIPKSLNEIMEKKITEALTVPLPETSSGSFSLTGLKTIQAKVEWADSVLIGPGIGRETETLQLAIEIIKFCIKQKKPTLLDADALFALSEFPEIIKKLNNKFLLTPHYGEFLRLSGFDKNELIRAPWQLLQDYLLDKNFIVNLKGAPSIVGQRDGQVFINPTGNQGLAKGGSGDVLSGIIAGLMGRGLDSLHSSITGNYIHGLAADNLIESKGMVSMLPSDLLGQIPAIIKSI
jgi:ADP-dependent NAD(P)H-hydrate dehydratase / NAD(P)H-hydrate epimerase